jgi:hypothetical protein
MQAWQLKCKVRLAACEGKLAFYRERHGDLAVERARSPYKGPSWVKKSDKMCILRGWIQRELAEIEFVKMMMNAGPIVGNRMVLHIRDGVTKKVRPGPSIIDLITREAEKRKIIRDLEANKVAEGLDLALEILYNPYRFLNEDERAAYNAAEEAEDKIVNDRLSKERGRETILPGERTGPSLAAIRKAAGPEPTIVRRKRTN